MKFLWIALVLALSQVGMAGPSKESKVKDDPQDYIGPMLRRVGRLLQGAESVADDGKYLDLMVYVCISHGDLPGDLSKMVHILGAFPVDEYDRRDLSDIASLASGLEKSCRVVRKEFTRNVGMAGVLGQRVHYFRVRRLLGFLKDLNEEISYFQASIELREAPLEIATHP